TNAEPSPSAQPLPSKQVQSHTPATPPSLSWSLLRLFGAQLGRNLQGLSTQYIEAMVERLPPGGRDRQIISSRVQPKGLQLVRRAGIAAVDVNLGRLRIG